MTPVFDRPTKRLIMLPGKWLRITKIPQGKIDDAEAIVLSALDRLLPFAYATVRPMYYLKQIHKFKNKEGDTIRQYEECVSLDTTTRYRMISNYYKLKRALKFLYEQGYVESYLCMKHEPRLRVQWVVDADTTREEIQELDYGFRPDYEHTPQPHRMKYRSKFKRLLKQHDIGFPAKKLKDIVPQGKLAKQWEPQVNKGSGEYDPDILMVREGDKHHHKVVNNAVYVKGETARNDFIVRLASILYYNTKGKEINCYG